MPSLLRGTLRSNCLRFWVLSGLLSLCLSASAGHAADAAPTHPLDPMSSEEIATAVAALRAAGRIGPDSALALLALHEPPKEEVLRYKVGDALRREAFAVVMDRASGKSFEAVVDLRQRRVLSWTEMPGAQPPILGADAGIAIAAVRADPRRQAAIRKRGITDFNQVQVDPWSAGSYDIPGEEGRRLVRAVAYYRGRARNPYARPIEGVIAYVDVNAGRVLQVIDTGVVPVPRASADLDEASVGRLRPAPRPLRIEQPEGAGFPVEGREVRWQKWRFRFAIHPREGLVLYTVGYEDGGRVRPVLYRASLSEMVVPYGDPSPGWFFRNAFDAGEVGMGRYANALVPGEDCPTNALLLPAVFCSERGAPYEILRAVALYERDGGLLWKHYDSATRSNETRRARDLVLGYITTIGNYEYGFNWIFRQDGSLELEALLTGIMAAKAVNPRDGAAGAHDREPYGHHVTANVVAVHHQHFFNFRLDLDVDGPGNSVVELNTEALPEGPENPYGNAFVMKETLLRRESAARRGLDLAAGRRWKVINPSVRNALGQPAGYALLPGENAVPYASPNSSVRKRAGFVDAHVWVTPYDPTQLYAAGPYPNQSKGGDGLPAWTRADRSIENRDVVLWYTMGVTHIPRPEEWPVMPVHRAGFRLVPSSFFDRNPALDVPRPR